MALAAILFLHATTALAQTGEFTACKSNLKNIGTALEMYASDHGGKYPASLRALAPKYLSSLPICPAAGKDTYSASYKPGGQQQYFICCLGHNHASAGYGENFPSYNGLRGLETGAQKAANAAGATVVFPESGPRYQVKIPAGWVIKSNNAYGVSLSNPKHPEASMSFGLANDPSDKATYFDRFMENAKKAKLDLINPRKFTLGALTGARATVKAKGKTMELWGCTDGRASLQLILQCSDSDYNKLKPDFEKLCRSLKAKR